MKKVMWIVNYDVRPNRYEFCQCPFDKLKDAKQYINENKNKRLFKYWQIVRQEYFTDKLGFGKTEIVESN